jgi:metal-sulfur cluster biosynthetic enzyme
MPLGDAPQPHLDAFLAEDHPIGPVAIAPERDGDLQPGIDELLVDDPSPETVREMLHEVIDPELGLDIVELGLLRSVVIDDGVATIRFTVTTPACPLSNYIEDEIRSCLWQLPGLRELNVACEYEPAWGPEDMTEDARLALGWD